MAAYTERTGLSYFHIPKGVDHFILPSRMRFANLALMICRQWRVLMGKTKRMSIIWPSKRMLKLGPCVSRNCRTANSQTERLLKNPRTTLYSLLGTFDHKWNRDLPFGIPLAGTVTFGIRRSIGLRRTIANLPPFQRTSVIFPLKPRLPFADIPETT